MFLNLFLHGVRAAEDEIPTQPEGGYVYFLSANDPDWKEKFIISKLSNITGEWAVEEEIAPQAVAGEKLFKMKAASKYYGASIPLDSPLKLKDETLVIQYEVRLEEELNCGGAYVKLFSNENYNQEQVSNETKYSIMFGPDKCGSTNKVHFIFRHQNPKTGVIEEKHMTDAPSIKTDKNNHLYTLIVRPDNTFEILIDAESVKQGNLLTDFAPSVNPPKMIDDPSDKKPEDWVDEAKIPDPEAKKPEDWDEEAPEYIPDPEKATAPEGWLFDEPKFVPDPEAKKPEDWDEDIHGEWEAPTIANPKCSEAPGCGEYEAPLIKNSAYKGKWHAPLIDNPAYKGVWKPRQIENPNYFEDNHPHNFMEITAVGFDLWEVNKMLGFTNIYIGKDEAAVMKWNEDHFKPKHTKQEAEQKKLEPKTEQSSNGGFVEKVSSKLQSFVDAYMNLYEQNKVVVIACSVGIVLVVLIPIVIKCLSSNDEEEEKPAEKVEEKKEEEKKAEEEEEKEEEEKKEEEKPAEKKEAAKKRTSKHKADNF